MSQVIQVLIADDHPVVRKGLRTILEEDEEVKVVAEAADGETAVELIGKLTPQVAVLDLGMPRLDGLGVAREIARRKLNTKALFLTLHASEDVFKSALELGVKGYILKDSVMQEITAGVKAVAAGQHYLSSALTARLLIPRDADGSGAREEDIEARLTPTERKIMRMIADGNSSKEIGAELSIHYRTIENHRTNICRKLGIEGANALLRFALQNKAKL